MLEITAALAGARLAANAMGGLLRRNREATPSVSGTNGSGSPADTREANVTARRIVDRYDVTNISPNQVSAMLQEFHRAGLLDNAQYHALSTIRSDLDAAGIEPDEPINLLDFFAEKLAEVSAPSASAPSTKGMPAAEPRSDWLQKLALMQSAPGVTPLDRFA